MEALSRILIRADKLIEASRLVSLGVPKRKVFRELELEGASHLTVARQVDLYTRLSEVKSLEQLIAEYLPVGFNYRELARLADLPIADIREKLGLSGNYVVEYYTDTKLLSMIFSSKILAGKGVIPEPEEIYMPSVSFKNSKENLIKLDKTIATYDGVYPIGRWNYTK